MKKWLMRRIDIQFLIDMVNKINETVLKNEDDVFHQVHDERATNL